jgi:septal ring-binding cell division protein DamX
MYYYGYGVTQDTESGIFWMNRAASAHYAPAIKALAAIRENNIEQARKRRYAPNESAPPRINTTHAENTVTGKKIESDEVIEALNTLPAPQPGHVTVMTQPDQTDQTALAKTEPPALKKMNNEPVIKPVAGFNSKKYTLQLLGSYYLSSVKARQAQLNLGTPTYIGQTKHNGRDWYILSVGQYPALGNAELAKLDLPQKIKDFKPWIRKCDELRWVG